MTNYVKFASISILAAFGLTACSGGGEGGAAISQANKTQAPPSSAAISATQQLNAPFKAFLETYVVQDNGINLVQYGRVSEADHQILKDYITTLSSTDTSGYNVDETFAYWFNLYNAETVNVILDNYPVSSIKKIDFLGPWDTASLTVNGKAMSLNNIEHDTIRASFDEPRIHFAFNCASIGCPNLKMSPWEAATLDADLTQAAVDYIASPRGVTVKDGKITAASIFDWYKQDFGSSQQDTLNYLAKYATGAKKTALQNAQKINKFKYNWDLNEAK